MSVLQAASRWYVFLAAVSLTGAGQDGPPAGGTFRNTSKDVSYVGSQACAGCHAGIYRSYRKTAMGRSMTPASAPAQLKKVKETVIIHNAKLNRDFSVFRKGSTIYQSEYEIDSLGTEVFRNAQKMEYAVGAGANGVTYIVRRGDALFEAPLSHYAKTGAWALSPGYESEDVGFSRPIAAGCIFCHSGLARPVRGKKGVYSDPAFQELAIGCENCHGPGQLHVRERSQGVPLPAKTDRSIVNPARLPGWLADNICMNCHQGGVTRVLKPGKFYDDFRPGMPLDQTLAIFSEPPAPGAPPSPLLEHHSLMALSKCYRASGGRLSCLACHDAHLELADSVAHYRKKCLACHEESGCRVSLSERNAHEPANDCAGCHMPKQELSTIAHSVLTDHRIVARKNEPLPEEAFHFESASLPGLVHVNAIPGQKDEVPLLTQLLAYGELANKNPTYGRRYFEVLERLAQADPNSTAVLSALGRKKLEEGTEEARKEAMQYLLRAVQQGSAEPADYESLANLQAAQAEVAKAVATLKQGLAVDAYYQPFYKALALIYIVQHRDEEARQAMRQELEKFPEDSFMRRMLKKLEMRP